MDYVQILKELSLKTGVSGYENNIAEHIRTLFQPYCDNVKIDNFFNVIGYKKGSMGKKKILITAHIDEIGFFVKSIDERGFLRLSNIGGIDNKILLAHEVTIHGKKDLTGIIGAKPPHLLTAEEAKNSIKLENLYVDTGMTHNEVVQMIKIGDRVTLKSDYFLLKGNKISSKSLDNRAGVLAMLMALHGLSKIIHESDIYFIATVQEEVGLRGATIAGYNIEPDAAIVIDAAHGDMPDCPKEQIFTLGKGVPIAIGPNLHKKLTKKCFDIAKENNIPYQIDIEPGDTGTEAWVLQVSRNGIPATLLSIPIRYMHTSIECVHMSDIKNAGFLAAQIASLNERDLEEVLCL